MSWSMTQVQMQSQRHYWQQQWQRRLRLQQLEQQR
jgi:hypothetical protein